MKNTVIIGFFKRKKLIYSFLIILVIFSIMAISSVGSSNQNLTKTAKKKDDLSTKIYPQVPYKDAEPTAYDYNSDGNKEAMGLSIERETALVLKVVDGDTIEVEINGGQYTLRYIGIDTPETVDPRKPVQCFGQEASLKNKELVEGELVSLEKDVSDTDKYGRLLRYVYVGNVFINRLLIEEGYAYSSPYPPDIKHQEEFDVAESEARFGSRGLWGACDGKQDDYKDSGQLQYSNTSSNDKDCSDFTTQKQAQDYFAAKGGGEGRNVDNLDRDGDGVVCESLP